MFERLMLKLDDRFERGDYYEAHQIYRTIYYRLMRENKYAEIYDLLFIGSVKLLDHRQFVSGADLANLLLEMMTKLDKIDQVNKTETELVQNIRSMFEKILPNTPERMHFIAKSLQIKFLPPSSIRKQFAETLWNEKNFSESRMHFIYSSDDGNNCALMLVEYQTSVGYPFEVDLMIAQFVLQVLCIENWQLAYKTFYVYTSNHPQIKCSKAPFTTPLLNFICFLFIAIEKFRGKSNVFNILCNLYEKCLSKDPCYNDYLTQIGEIYFGIEKKAQSKGLFSNLFSSLFDFGQDVEPDNNATVAETHQNVPQRDQDVDLD